jgi:hypothetical protein
MLHGTRNTVHWKNAAVSAIEKMALRAALLQQILVKLPEAGKPYAESGKLFLRLRKCPEL